MTKPITLVILDGWGHSDTPDANAIYTANTPTWDKLWQQCPHTLLSGSGDGVGLPDGQMGNSEVGHLNIGAGRIVYQEYTRVSKAIAEGDFFENPVLCDNIDQAIQQDKALHIFGLLSPGGVHSHEDHIVAAIQLAHRRGCQYIYLHAFLDGRDTPPQSAMDSLVRIDSLFKELGNGAIASIVGRYYAMDRDQRWERVQCAYDLVTGYQAQFHADTAMHGLDMAYQRGENDEFVQSTAIHAPTDSPVTINDGDVVLFMNFRADRARQLSHTFCSQDFSSFPRHKQPKLSAFISLTQYAADIPAQVAYPTAKLNNVLAEYLSKHNKTQLRIAETEKYAHVTFFFNGGVESPFPGEYRELIPSPDVATYDLQPQMHAPELTDKLVAAIESDQYDVIICNYANPDMVGHTGNFDATVTAIETIDHCLKRISDSLQKVSGELIVTADHGNAEKMRDEITQQAHTAHTSEPVPFVYMGRDAEIVNHHGKLSDIAPTILHLMGMTPPTEMTGKTILNVSE